MGSIAKCVIYLELYHSAQSVRKSIWGKELGQKVCADKKLRKLNRKLIDAQTLGRNYILPPTPPLPAYTATDVCQNIEHERKMCFILIKAFSTYCATHITEEQKILQVFFSDKIVLKAYFQLCSQKISTANFNNNLIENSPIGSWNCILFRHNSTSKYLALTTLVTRMEIVKER